MYDRSINSEGKPCSATAFVGYYKNVCRLWTRRHCLTDKQGDKKSATMNKARKAKYWFLYRTEDRKDVVEGEKLIQGEDLRWDKV